MESITDPFHQLQAIQIESPVSKIIRQVKQLIVSGQLKPGDRLPAERILAERFAIGRSYIREAIMKLEFYGMLKTSPQSGTFVSGYNIKILDTIFSDIISFNKDDFSALIEARYYMELNTVRMAALRRTEEDIKGMEEALNDFDDKVVKGLDAVEEDMLFHIKIAGAAKNSVMESMILTTIPDVIKNIIDRKLCGKDSQKQAVVSHHKILQAIIERNADAAATAMAAHLAPMLSISQNEYARRNGASKKKKEIVNSVHR